MRNEISAQKPSFPKIRTVAGAWHVDAVLGERRWSRPYPPLRSVFLHFVILFQPRNRWSLRHRWPGNLKPSTSTLTSFVFARFGDVAEVVHGTRSHIPEIRRGSCRRAAGSAFCAFKRIRPGTPSSGVRVEDFWGDRSRVSADVFAGFFESRERDWIATVGVGFERRFGFEGEFFDVGREFVVAVQHLIERDFLAGMGRHSSH